MADVDRLDFVSISTGGTEEMVAESLTSVPGISLGVLLIEVRNDGQRPRLLRRLIGSSLRYVGQMEARGEVISDAYVNMSHMARFFPRSVALTTLPSRPKALSHR